MRKLEADPEAAIRGIIVKEVRSVNDNDPERDFTWVNGSRGRGRLVLYKSYRYTVSTYNTNSYLTCNQKQCGVRMILNEDKTKIVKFPTRFHNHDSDEMVKHQTIFLRNKMEQEIRSDPALTVEEAYTKVIGKYPVQLRHKFSSVRSKLYHNNTLIKLSK